MHPRWNLTKDLTATQYDVLPVMCTRVNDLAYRIQWTFQYRTEAGSRDVLDVGCPENAPISKKRSNDNANLLRPDRSMRNGVISVKRSIIKRMPWLCQTSWNDHTLQYTYKSRMTDGGCDVLYDRRFAVVRDDFKMTYSGLFDAKWMTSVRDLKLSQWMSLSSMSCVISLLQRQNW